MLVHYKQIVRRFNALRTKKRYKEKRIRRAFLTEAYLNHIPWQIDVEPEITLKIPFWTEGNLPKEEIEKYTTKPVKFNWFEKFLFWIKVVFK